MAENSSNYACKKLVAWLTAQKKRKAFKLTFECFTDIHLFCLSATTFLTLQYSCQFHHLQSHVAYSHYRLRVGVVLRYQTVE